MNTKDRGDDDLQLPPRRMYFNLSWDFEDDMNPMWDGLEFDIEDLDALYLDAHDGPADIASKLARWIEVEVRSRIQSELDACRRAQAELPK